MASTRIDAAAADRQPVEGEGAGTEEWVTWRVVGRDGPETVRGWTLEVADGVLVLRGGQGEFLRAWSPMGWNGVERL